MAGEFTISVEGLRQVEEELGRLYARSRDLTPLMEVLGDILVAGTRDRFERGEGPDGEEWEPSERALVLGEKTMIDTGRLRDSVHFQIAPDQVEVGSNLIYAGVRQRGATIRPVNGPFLIFKTILSGWVKAKEVVQPARPYLGISDTDEDAIRGAVAIYAEAGPEGLA